MQLGVNSHQTHFYARKLKGYTRRISLCPSIRINFEWSLLVAASLLRVFLGFVVLNFAKEGFSQVEISTF